MDNALTTKIKKLLALAERAGTEHEAELAMAKAQELLSKHGLHMGDVQDAGDEPKESYEHTEFSEQVGVMPWKRIIWNNVAELYFCQYYSDGPRKHYLVGKTSNIAISEYLIRYLIRSAESMAEKGSREVMARRDYAHSFKVGFARRIAARCREEIARAKANGIKDSATGNALIVHPLYTQAKTDIAKVLKELNINLTSNVHRNVVRHEGGYNAGQEAGSKASLAANAVGTDGRLAKQIARG